MISDGFLTLTVLTVFSGFLSLTESKCVWYDKCGFDKISNKELNCAYNGDPKPLNATAKDQLLGICSHMSEDEAFCCSDIQVTELVNSFNLVSALLGRCPSCLFNFKRVFCDFTCSADHDKYLTVTNTSQSYTGKELVSEMEFRMSEKFALAAYDSCKEVVNTLTSGSVLDLLCGPWGASLCTPNRLFTYVGDKSNGQTPIQINFDFIPDDGDFSRAYDGEAPFCYEPTPEGGPACSCTDCEASCSPPDFTSTYNLDRDIYSEFTLPYSAAIIVIFAVLLVAFLVVVFMRSKSKIHPISEGNQKDLKSSGKKESKFRDSWLKVQLAVVRVQQNFFELHGRFCSTYPALIIVVCLAIAVAMGVGAMFSEITTDPVKLWSSKTSPTRMENDFYEEKFTAFFRIEQVIIAPTREYAEKNHFLYKDLFDGERNYSAVFSREFMSEVYKLQKAIENLEGSGNVKLSDVCHQPLAPENKVCNIQTIWSYWQNSPEEFARSGVNENSGHNDTYLDHFLMCTRNPVLQSAQTAMQQGCLSDGGLPALPYFVMGGFNATSQEDKMYEKSTALILTFLLRSEPEYREKAEIWELEFVDFMQKWKNSEDKPKFFDVAFNTQRAIEDELRRSSLGDMPIITASYVCMFVYVVLSLGKIRSWKTLFIDVKFMLSLCGTIIVLLSVVSSIGFFGYVGLETTVVVFQILPFLILAVGVDNLFILVKTLEHKEYEITLMGKSDDDSKNKNGPQSVIGVIGKVIGEVGPSIFLSTCAQASSFFLGVLSEMPAVRSFALYAAMSLIMNFVFQMTIFVALMALDLRRVRGERTDILCCFKVEDAKDEVGSQSWLSMFFERIYTPMLLSTPGRIITVIAFVIWTCCSVYSIPRLDIGLETELAMPYDSHVLKYLLFLKEHLAVGAPIYFVVDSEKAPDFDYFEQKTFDKICGGLGCNPDSLQAQIKLWSKQSNVTYVATPAQSWIDDYYDWLGSCCRAKKSTGEYCPPSASSEDESEDGGDDAYEDYYAEYYADYDPNKMDDDEPPEDICVQCLKPGKKKSIEPSMSKYLPHFLNQNPGKSCPKGGKASYRTAISYSATNDSSRPFKIDATSFFTFHTVLKTSNDFTEGMKWTRRLAANISDMLNEDLPEGNHVRVFPYSLFYVYYEQYGTMPEQTAVSLVVSLAVVFLVTLIFTGFDISSAGVVMFIILLTLVNLIGLMQFLGITLNAISLMNLVMSIGIGVEFSSHIVSACRHLELNQEESEDEERRNLTKLDRAKISLNEWGPILLAGIHVTNFIGVVILGAAKSKIFLIYFFSMYLGLVIIGALHGLLLLPVLLSYI